MHFTGALLLDPRDAALLNESLQYVSAYVPIAAFLTGAQQHAFAPEVPAPAGDVPMQVCPWGRGHCG